ncbi:hypothetical protein SYNPS1DRAFT_24388, partial [Syncephalis pseudoplumigaleata]
PPSLNTAANAVLAGHRDASSTGDAFARPRVVSGGAYGGSPMSASAPVTRCSSPRRRSLESEAFQPTSYGAHLQMAGDKGATSALPTVQEVPHPAAAQAAAMQAASYRAGGGPISLPSSPTHRQHPGDTRAHRWQHVAHHPYAVPSRPYGHSRQNSFTADGRPLALMQEGGYATPLVNANAMMPSAPTAASPATGASMAGVQMSTSATLGPKPMPPASYPSVLASTTAPAAAALDAHNGHSNGNGGGGSALVTLERLRRRRENHNHVERRRRDHINGTIRALASLLPDRGRGADGQRRNKGAILE